MSRSSHFKYCGVQLLYHNIHADGMDRRVSDHVFSGRSEAFLKSFFFILGVFLNSRVSLAFLPILPANFLAIYDYYIEIRNRSLGVRLGIYS